MPADFNLTGNGYAVIVISGNGHEILHHPKSRHGIGLRVHTDIVSGYALEHADKLFRSTQPVLPECKFGSVILEYKFGRNEDAPAAHIPQYDDDNRVFVFCECFKIRRILVTSLCPCLDKRTIVHAYIPVNSRSVAHRHDSQ